MKRVLLLAEAGVDLQARRAMQSLAEHLGSDYIVVRHIVPTGDRLFGNVQLLRTLRADRFDAVHAWGLPALLVAAMAHSGPIVFSFTSFPTLSDVRWLRAAMSYREVHAICPTSTMHRFCVEHGVPVERCHLIRPGVEFGRVNRRRDSKLRMALGFAESDHVFLLPGECTRESNCVIAAWVVAILNLLVPRYRLLAWGPGPMTQRMVDFMQTQSQHNTLAVADRRLGRAVEFEELLAAADGVLITANGSVATLPIAICMAAGLPIVSTVTAEVAELLEDRHTAAMASSHLPREITRRIQDLQADKNLQWAIADMAKTEAFEYFAHSRFMHQYRAIFGQLMAGEKVAVPEKAPGAGLRFHGLG